MRRRRRREPSWRAPAPTFPLVVLSRRKGFAFVLARFSARRGPSRAAPLFVLSIRAPAPCARRKSTRRQSRAPPPPSRAASSRPAMIAFPRRTRFLLPVRLRSSRSITPRFSLQRLGFITPQTLTSTSVPPCTFCRRARLTPCAAAAVTSQLPPRLAAATILSSHRATSSRRPGFLLCAPFRALRLLGAAPVEQHAPRARCVSTAPGHATRCRSRREPARRAAATHHNGLWNHRRDHSRRWIYPPLPSAISLRSGTAVPYTFPPLATRPA